MVASMKMVDQTKPVDGTKSMDQNKSMDKVKSNHGMKDPESHRDSSYPLFSSGRLYMLVLTFFAIMAAYSSYPALNFAIICMVDPGEPNQSINTSVINPEEFNQSITRSMINPDELNQSVSLSVIDPGEPNEINRSVNQSLINRDQLSVINQQFIQSMLNKTDQSLTRSLLNPGGSNGTCFRLHDYFHWDKQAQANLLAAFAWGATAASIPIGWLSDKYGGKWVLLSCLAVSAITSSLSPWAASRGLYWLFATRVFAGMFVASTIPCVTSIAARWSLAKERATLTAFSLNGANFIQLIVISISGLMCKSSMGWPLIFYSCAALAAVMTAVWCALYTDDPGKCRLVSEKERELLEKCRCGPTSDQKVLITPWKHILFSKVAWAIYICHFCNMWGLCFVSIFVPTYSKEVLGLDMASNGLFSALPVGCQFISYFLFGVLADKLTCRSRSTTFSVRVFNIFTMGVPCLGMLGLAFTGSGTSPALAIALFCVCQFFYLTSTAGFLRSILLIAPKFSGTVSAVSHFVAFIATIGMPYVVGFITRHGTVQEWQIAFFLSAAFSAIGGVVFLFFGSGEEQNWAKSGDKIQIQRELSFEVVKY